MENLNIFIPFLTALIPLVVGAIYYNPALLGNAWMKVADMNEEKIKSGNMALIFGLTYFFSLLLSGFLIGFTIHQSNIESLFVDADKFGIAASEAESFITNFQEKYSHLHRTFSHGSVHGIIAALFFAFPVIAINALFERKGWKYIFIHLGYWVISLGLMGGVICQFF